MRVIDRLETIFIEAMDCGEYSINNIPLLMMKMDADLSVVIQQFSKLPPQEQEVICSYITNEIAWMLLGYAVRMATYALRLADQQVFDNGLTALRMTLGVVGSREILRILSLYYDVHKRKGLHIQNQSVEEDEFSIMVYDFWNRCKSDKSLHAMGYKLGRDDNKNLMYTNELK